MFGYGPAGRATTGRLIGQGFQVEVAQRKKPFELAAGMELQVCDVLDVAAVKNTL